VNFLRKWVFHNWHLKLLALTLSFSLWAALHTEPSAEAAFEVPLVFQNVPAGLDLSGEEPAQVRVVLRGRAALLRRIETVNVFVSVDLAGSPGGAIAVRLTREHVELPLGTELARIAPAEIRVRLEPRAAR